MLLSCQMLLSSQINNLVMKTKHKKEYFWEVMWIVEIVKITAIKMVMVASLLLVMNDSNLHQHLDQILRGQPTQQHKKLKQYWYPSHQLNKTRWHLNSEKSKVLWSIFTGVGIKMSLFLYWQAMDWYIGKQMGNGWIWIEI